MSSQSPRQPGDGLRILIVDDNVANAQTTGWMVELFDHDYRIAFSAADALATAAAYRPNLAMLDIGLPDMNGFDLCQALQGGPGGRDCVYIAQTGWDEPSYRERAVDAGFSEYLLKPFSVEKLEAVLNKFHPDKA